MTTRDWYAIGYIFVGLVGIAISVWRFLAPQSYPPGDIRNEDWFYPVTSAAFALYGLFFVAVGTRRLMRRRC